ncbi:ferritin-like domain-containing protein [Leptolyngbya ohadii]|uniref:ferritin-like domain-containing protein n=1 Tax=Leptolyngbya ohadii TaxID=1962290 RepID=UPI000B59AC40|nr:ferritin-like domain-containing protein [Leptolyngbya ohadii]
MQENTSRSFDRHFRSLSRRSVLVGGTIAGFVGALGLATVGSRPGQAMPGESMMPGMMSDAAHDAEILNGALYYEHQAIWGYTAAAGKLSNTATGQAVLALAKRNQADHIAHRDTLINVIRDLGGTPVMAEQSYDLSSYIERREGNLDSDVNIAKLALALETDAAIAYVTQSARLKNLDLISAGASIGATESSHATAIRAAFASLGMDIEIVPSSFVNADNRSEWILTV